MKTKIIKFVFMSNSNKKLDKTTNDVKQLLKNCGEVVKGPVCFKQQRQLTLYYKFNSTIDKLLQIKIDPKVKVNVLLVNNK